MEELKLIKLKNNNGASASFTNVGAAVVSLFVPDKNGKFEDVVLGYDKPEDYINGEACHGAIVGRFANRIGGGKFSLNGKEYSLYQNDGENCLHGGKIGFGKKIWTVSEVKADGEKPRVTFNYVSPDGEENFPGEVSATVTYILNCDLNGDNSLFINYSATTNADTILNLTNHAYFNLGGYNSGAEEVMNTELKIFAENYTPFNEFNIPTGELTPVKGTIYDFTEAKLIGADIVSGRIGGYDNNYVFGYQLAYQKSAALHNFMSRLARQAARALHEKSGRVMEVVTDMPAMQFYTGNHLNETGKNGAKFEKHGGFCLETQFTPDTPNLPDFASCVLKAGETFSSFTEYRFSVLGE